MEKDRLGAFSDGVIAIIITIMVLELKSPHGVDVGALRPVIRTLLLYLLSFTFVAIYWNNHHHLYHVVKRVDGRVLWANMHLLFWLSLTPFVMGWLGEAGLEPWPVAMYGVVLMMSAISYFIMTRALLRLHAPDSRLARALGADFKGRISLVIYAAGIAIAAWLPLVSVGCYIAVAIIWLVPDRRIERVLMDPEPSPTHPTGPRPPLE
jgi:uncharacterized membrane protein